MRIKRYNKITSGISSFNDRSGKFYMKRTSILILITADKEHGCTVSVSDGETVQYSFDLGSIRQELKELIDCGLL